MTNPKRRRSRTLRRGSVALALALLASACSSDTTETVGTQTPDAEALDESEQGTSVGGASQELAVGDLAPGEYTFGELGTLATITTEDPWFVPVAQESVVILEDPDDTGFVSDGQALILARPTGFLSEGDTRSGYVDVTGPTDDIDAWIDLVDFQIESRELTEVASWETEVLTGRGPSGDDTFLRTNAPVPFNGTPDGDYIYVRSALLYRIWLIDQPTLDPIVAIAITEPDSEIWFERAQRVVDSLELGPPAAHPNPPTASVGGCIEGGAELVGDIAFDSLIDLTFTADTPIDGGSGFDSPRTEIYQPGFEPIGFFVLGPVDEDPDFPDAATARARIIGDRPLVGEPMLSGFGTEAVGAIVDSTDAGGSLGRVPFGGGIDVASVSANSAFWFFDTEHGVYLVNALGDKDLDASMSMVSSIVPTMQLVEGLCG